MSPKFHQLTHDEMWGTRDYKKNHLNVCKKARLLFYFLNKFGSFETKFPCIIPSQIHYIPSKYTQRKYYLCIHQWEAVTHDSR